MSILHTWLVIAGIGVQLVFVHFYLLLPQSIEQYAKIFYFWYKLTAKLTASL